MEVNRMKPKRDLLIGVTFLVLLAALAVGQKVLESRAVAEAAGVQAPMFEVDPLWPKPLPNHWLQGNTIGVSVDAQDHVWIIHRGGSLEPKEVYASTNPPGASCCLPAPPVLEFDPAGNLVGHWGGPGEGYEWPESNHGITVDSKGNVWIGGNGNTDTQILKFDKKGKFLLQLGHQGKHNGSNDLENFWRPAKIYEDPAAGEMYIADGYGNRRVIVVERETGKYKRHWGAFGAKPDDGKVPDYTPSAPELKQFNTVHCADVSKDGFVYVCDRVNDRVQVFRKDGTYVKEQVFDKNTLQSGSLWDMTF